MAQFNAEVNRMFADLIHDWQREDQRRKLDAIRENPAKHRLTRLMEKGATTGYTYASGPWKTTKRKRERTIFCVAKNKNAAGVFLMWRQVDSYAKEGRKWKWKQSARFDFAWTPSRREGLSLIGKKAAKAIEAVKPKPAFTPTPGRGIGEALN